jgi:hypothetical protein
MSAPTRFRTYLLSFIIALALRPSGGLAQRKPETSKGNPPHTPAARDPVVTHPHAVARGNEHEGLALARTRGSCARTPATIPKRSRTWSIRVPTRPDGIAGLTFTDKASHGKMSGVCEVRVDGPKRHHYRLFCCLRGMAHGSDSEGRASFW